MKRLRTWIIMALVAVAATATTSWTSGSTILLTDEQGGPASDAYVRFHYTGYLINPAHPVSYVAGGSEIIRADAGGRATIPFRVHFRRPFPPSTPPSVFIDCVYVPRLHNAFGPIGRHKRSQRGVFASDEKREHVTILDVSQDPHTWEGSLRTLHDCIRDTISQVGSIAPAAPDDAATRAHARELIAHLRLDYTTFLARYGRTPRSRPRSPEWLSDDALKRWQEQVDAQLAREPLWGPYVERMWEQDLKALDRLEASLR
jgi:hypothetical protein